MKCKNCGSLLRTDFRYCPECGAKVVVGRITMGGLWADIRERYLNYDNTLLKTFAHMFTRPKAVVGGYLEGTRKKYLNPISYFTIALTFSGLFIFIQRKFFPGVLDSMYESMPKSRSSQSPEYQAFMSDMLNGMYEYFSIWSAALIPVMGLMSKMTFYDRKFNYSEHLVVALYGYSQMSILLNFFYIVTLANTEAYLFTAYLAMPLQIVFFGYLYARVFGYSFGTMIFKTVIFLALLSVLFVMWSIALGLYMAFFTNVFDYMKNPADPAGEQALDSIAPVVSYIADSARNWAS